MKIDQVQIENFLTIQKAQIDLSDRGLLLIQGDNKDDSSADSNGAGKSSIADAICWALYGVTARDVSGDSVVNRTAKKDCAVTVTLSDDAETYQIIRYRKHSSGKNTTVIHNSRGTALHKGTERETQEVINALVGCSLEVFQAAVYAGQERMPDLPAMTDKHLKLMIEEAAGVEVLARAYTIARERYSSAMSALSTLLSNRSSTAISHVALAAKLTDQQALHADFEAKRTPLAKAELAHVVTLKAQVKELDEKIAKIDASVIDAELATIAASFASLKSEDAELARLDGQVKATAKALTLAESAAKAGKRLHTNAVEALRNVSDTIGKPCGECGKVYCAHDLDAAKKLRQKDLDDATEELRKLASEYATARSADETAQKLAKDYRSSMTDVTEMAARQRKLQLTLDDLRTLKFTREGVMRQIEERITSAKTCMSKDNPYQASVKVCMDSMNDAADKLSKLEVEIKAAESTQELLSDAMKVYGPAGVRAHILDTVTPYLNHRTSHYLSTLADGNINAVWNTLTKNAKGEMKEKFSIEVTNNKGADSFAGLSGGEKRKVRLATAMALQDLVASRATKPIDIFIADEVDHALDAAGLERLMSVLNDKAKERGTVMVISHSDLKDWIDDVIIVTKDGGYGQVSGATCK